METILEAIFNRCQSDKGLHHGYHRYYEDLLRPLRDQTFTLVEVGYGDGSSLLAWLTYFPFVHVHVLDIEVATTGPRFRVYQGDQGDPNILRAFAGTVPTPQVIVDDGSHVPEHQLLGFNTWFTDFLAPGGWYILEDIETSYWQEGYCYGNLIRCGVDHPLNLVGVFSRSLHRLVNQEFADLEADSALAPATWDWVSSVSFGTNCIIVRKKTEAEKQTYQRPYRFAACTNPPPGQEKGT